ncbi:MAG: hypothetical protein K1X44_07505 [Alphaproteobacteria bacterium]|nr:hypothetical protein [Alphaproteobacteria bacterium]
MNIKPLTLEGVQKVASNLRVQDQVEIYATRWSDDPKILAEEALSYTNYGYLVSDKDHPVAAMGLLEMWPHVWSAWMFATPEWANISFDLTAYLKKTLPYYFKIYQAHRIQCHSWIGHKKAHRWLEYLGAQPENIISYFGKNKEDFITYAWIL